MNLHNYLTIQLNYKLLKNFKKKNYKGDYLGYQDIKFLGNISQLNLSYESGIDLLEHWTESFYIKIKDYLNDMSDNITYSILPILKFKYPGERYKSITISKSIKVTRFISSELLSSKLFESVIKSTQKYDLEGLDVNLYLLSRPWLSSKDFNTDMSTVTKTLNDQIETDVFSNFKRSELNESNKIKKLKDYKYKNNFMDNYGEPILNKNNNLIGYKLNGKEYALIKTYYNADNLLCNKIFVQGYDISNLPLTGKTSDVLTTWIDIQTDFGYIRELDDMKYFYDKNNNLFNLEINYNLPKFPVYKQTSSLNNKVGTIDLETYGSNLGLGYHQTYAAGFSIKDKTQLFYIEQGETSNEFVHSFFCSIFTYSENLNNYVFYVHNLGRFDSIFIIKSLTKYDKFSVTPTWKDNSILSVTIKYLDKKKIILLDSLRLILDNLENILKSFYCKVKKGKFPYKAVNERSLFYKGIKPAKKFYEEISDVEYIAIPEANWSMKTETLKYLKSDLEGLLEAVIKFRDSAHKKYNLDITKFKTLPGLALAAYTSNYVPDKLKPKLKMIKGSLEKKKLRSAYLGGSVDVYINEISSGYYYDVNSQYPAAMLNNMPIGDPVLSLETDLNKIFGFTYGEILCPHDSVLQVPFILHKDPVYGINTCPRGKFKRLIFSEEIKYALKYGYKFNVEYSYIFERGKDLFTDFVKDHYEIKKNSKDLTQRNISKLFLNSLYGRLGMSEIEDKMEIVDKESA